MAPVQRDNFCDKYSGYNPPIFHSIAVLALSMRKKTARNKNCPNFAAPKDTAKEEIKVFIEFLVYIFWIVKLVQPG